MQNYITVWISSQVRRVSSVVLVMLAFSAFGGEVAQDEAREAARGWAALQEALTGKEGFSGRDPNGVGDFGVKIARFCKITRKEAKTMAKKTKANLEFQLVKAEVKGVPEKALLKCRNIGQVDLIWPRTGVPCRGG